MPKDPPITPARDHRSGPSRIVANPVAERFVGSIRRKLLDRILIIGQRHAMAVLCRHELHNNDHRPHRTLGQALPYDHSLAARQRRSTTSRAATCNSAAPANAGCDDAATSDSINAS